MKIKIDQSKHELSVPVPLTKGLKKRALKNAVFSMNTAFLFRHVPKHFLNPAMLNGK